MKYILIIGDGMADNPVPTLDNKTPLQHAAIPVMDGLAAKGEVGNVGNCPAAGATASPWGCSPRTPSSLGASTASTPPSRWSRRWRTSGRPKSTT